MGAIFSKWGKLLLVLGLVFSVFSVSTIGHAATKETVINKQMITTASLNVRASSTTSSKVIGWFKNKTKFKAIAKTSNNWYRLSYKGKKGYVSGKYVKTVSATKPTPAPSTPKIVQMNVPLIVQRPQLPTGCEITNIAMMLRYAGKNVDKVKLAKEMKRHKSNPNYGFVGNPFSRSGWTIYPPALMSQVKKHAGSAKNMTGTSLSGIKTQLNKKRPVVAWVSNFHGFSVHAITITGYDKNNFYYNDSWSGQKNARISQSYFNTCWNKQAKRAISY
ncbi:C39 family peptidase [Listeria seeligeri]|uniref:C39 family peptidase n=1 Tax=Listeria seeligeri TaxID=1640 RepID=UPI001888A0C8|nr:C39 family peptidase [Listeria seeligeri]MBF2599888.1 C39 family peptidase [Listeria seeligeri]